MLNRGMGQAENWGGRGHQVDPEARRATSTTVSPPQALPNHILHRARFHQAQPIDLDVVLPPVSIKPGLALRLPFTRS